MTDNDIRFPVIAKEAAEYVVRMVKYIVDHPDDVKINVSASGYTMTVSLETNEDDVGQVIGKRAHLITSIRSMLSAVAGRNKIVILFDYITEQDNRRSGSSSGGRYNVG